MKAVITGITGLRNRGVEALVVPTIEQLQQRHPDLAISVLTKTPDYDHLRLQTYQAEVINDSLRRPPQSRLGKIRAKLTQLRSTGSSHHTAIKERLQSASIVIASGGDVFSSDYGALPRHLQPLEIALDAGVPVMFLAQSIGPFKRQDEIDTWRKVALRSKLITVREEISYNYLTKDLKLSPHLVKHTADPAFLLAPPPPETIAKMLNFYGIDRDRPTIALGISQGITRYANCNYDHHLKAWYEVIQRLLDELKAQVILIPHVQEIAANNNDCILATNLMRLLAFNPHVRVASADHTASEFKGLISACDMVIAERMHAAIAGLSTGVCTVAVGYSIKAEGIMTNLLGATSLQSGLLIPIQQFLDPVASYTAIRTAWEQRQDVSAQLHQVLPQTKQASASNFDMIAGILS
ncbi:MAG: polysaccharide pyruvyl transferase family protein [Lyngbya sp. HA4199-MV5]|jgi:colanic acid/amylovoran biosynthesis protein|nr:polysaccharide pyruvyl transferase family protein [Lyngbya sp. HA4199-MV5]